MKFFSINGAVRPVLVWSLLMISLLLFGYGARQHAERVNTDVTQFDQNSYLYYARLMHETHYSYIGDRNRMPAYPFLLSLGYQSEWSEQQFFSFAKSFNILLSALLLMLLYAILRRYVRTLSAVTIWLIAVFTVFLFKAPYVQAEVLFYFLNFVLFILVIRLFTKPDWRWAILCGVVFGVAHLTKASVLPELALFLGWGSVQTFYLAYRQIRRSATPWPIFRQHGAVLSLVLLSFLSVIFPYLGNSKRIFGQYFYNVNSTFYVWCDTVEEWKSGPKAHGDRFGWPQMNDAEIPSLKNYLAHHSPARIAERLFKGSLNTVRICIGSYGFFKYLALFSGFMMVGILLNGSQVKEWLKNYLFIVLFLSSFFTVYFIFVAWWNFLAAQLRHILALFLPWMFCLVYLIDRFHHTTLRWRQRSLPLRPFLFGLVILLLSVEIMIILTHRILTMESGI